MEENKKEQVEETTEETMETEETVEKKEKKLGKKDKIAKLEEEIASLKEELAASKNAYYKAYADTENLKKRLQNDADTIRKYRAQGFASDILPAIDNLERALAVTSENEEMINYMNGLQMVYQQIMSALSNEGIKVIEAKDKPFDPNLHQALLTEKVEGVESGIVLEEIQKGYILKDRVIRATLVKVSE